MSKFHLAFKVKDIESTYHFYHKILDCNVGRKTDDWIDFDFFNHQLSAHVSQNIPDLDFCGRVDKVSVPIPHFGCIVGADDFRKIKENLLRHSVPFIIKPQTRYKGEKGEQETMFVLDFSNNPIEFKCFKDERNIFKNIG